MACRTTVTLKPNYTLTTTSDVAYMDYSIDVTDKQTLYFDCFDKLSNSLSEDINGSFMVTVNGQVKADGLSVTIEQRTFEAWGI